MALSSKNVEAACCDDLLLILLAVGSNLFEDLQLARIRQIFFPIQNLLEHEIRTAAQENVGATARHIRGDGHSALASSLGDNLGFALMLFRVEDVVLDAGPAQGGGEPLRFFDGNRAD